MIALYILTAIVVSLDWKYTNLLFCYVITKHDTYFVAISGPLLSFTNPNQSVLLNITQFGGFILADGLLVWRCFHACGRSFRHAVLPIGFIIIEAGLVIWAAVYTCSTLMWDTNYVVPFIPKPNSPPIENSSKLTQDNVFADRIAGSALVSTALTSLVCTFMICRQISKYTSIHNSGTRSRYKRLLLTLVQSSGVYSATVCIKAILEFLDKVVPHFRISGTLEGQWELSQVVDLHSYSSVVVTVIVGLVPTLMVASVSWSRSGNDAEVISGTLSVPLDIDTSGPHFATQSRLTNSGDDINLPDEHESEDEYDDGDSQIMARKEGYYSGGVSNSEPSTRALQSKTGKTGEEMV
ncbi:hypothetical protein D9613_008027 [Agrocybe pediades]|uniref:Uncharacterized protein n=1 Tax=Agrocybe pediades TaxID=84607 RepID=A0A8H4QNA2_9AGAR|nr:hypothetical protein D9613_008027 [Agrocybe pediades]